MDHARLPTEAQLKDEIIDVLRENGPDVYMSGPQIGRKTGTYRQPYNPRANDPLSRKHYDILRKLKNKLSGNVEKLTESVNSLNTRVAVLEERTQGTAKTVHVILASFIGPLVVAILAAIIIHLITRNRNSEGRAAATNTTQANHGDGEIASSPITSSRFPEGKELTEYLKSDDFATKEPI